MTALKEEAVGTGSTTSGTSTSATVVLGPLTRLGRAVIAAESDTPLFAVARDATDLDALASLPVTPLLDNPGSTISKSVAPERLTILVCALGPAHPTAPRTEHDSDRVARDLHLVQDLIDSSRAGEVHLVFVSSVIALAPGADRRYYGGWKCLVEHQLRHLVEQHSAASRFSVVYPGRLMSASDRTRPWHRAHTTYSRLVSLLRETSAHPVPSRVVGLDARAWLVTHGLSVAFSSFSGPRKRTKRTPGTGTERHDPR